VSNEAEQQFTTGFTKSIHSLLAVRARIALQSTRRRFRSTQTESGCTLLSILVRTNAYIFWLFSVQNSNSRWFFPAL